jgi:hypothetical protein
VAFEKRFTFTAAGLCGIFTHFQYPEHEKIRTGTGLSQQQSTEVSAKAGGLQKA